MAAATTSVEIFRGDTWVRSWRITKNGEAVDFSGASAKLQVRSSKSADDSTIIVEAVIGDGLEFGTDSNIELFIQTDSLSAGKYYFDLEVTYSDGFKKTYEQSTLILKQDITRG